MRSVGSGGVGRSVKSWQRKDSGPEALRLLDRGSEPWWGRGVDGGRAHDPGGGRRDSGFLGHLLRDKKI